MLRALLLAAGAVAFLVAWEVTSAAHDPEYVRTWTCALFAAPFALPALIADVVAKVRAKAKAAAAPARRPGYGSFGQAGRRR